MSSTTNRQCYCTPEMWSKRCTPCQERYEQEAVERAMRDYPQDFRWTIHTTNETKSEDEWHWMAGVIADLYGQLDALQRGEP